MNLDLFRSLRVSPRSSKSSARRRGNHRRAFGLEPLESRELLAATPGSVPIGAGFNALTYYTTIPMFKDVMKMTIDQWDVVEASSPLSPFNIPGVPEPTMDSNGYPIGLGNLPSQGYALDTFVFTHNGGIYPTGTYTLTFDGGGTVEILGSNQPAQSFSQSGGTGSPSNVYINSTGSDGIVIAIISSNTSDYVRNIRLVMPGYQSNYVSEPFNPAFLAEAEPLQQIRVAGLMGMANSNQNVGMTWAQETPMTYKTQTRWSGVSVQYLVDLANVLQENLWVNMPVGADSSFVTNFSQYVEQNLDSNLKVYVEYGNEVWNSFYYSEWSYVEQYATTNNISFWQAEAALATNMWNVWLQSFSGQTGRVQRVVANQFSVPSNFSAEIGAIVKLASPSDPDHGFEVISGASYFGPNTNNYNASTTVQQIELDSMADLTTLEPYLQSFMSMVTSWSKQLGQDIPTIMYESGLSISVSSMSVPWWNAYVEAQTDSGMYAVLSTYFQEMQDAGITGFNYSDLVYLTDIYGEWGTVNYIGEPPSLTPKYDALIDFIDAQGQSLYLDDTVTAESAGTPTSFTVTAYDASGNVETGYRGTVQFSSSDADASLPANYTFTAADAGEHTFSFAFDTVGTQAIGVTDSTNGLYSLDWGVSVTPAATSVLNLSGYPSPATAGIGENMYLWAFDSYGNIATNYTGTVKFTSSDPQASLPGNATFTSNNLGYYTFVATLKTVGVQSVTATDTSSSSITGKESGITIQPAAAKSFTVTGFPSSITAGVAHSFTVTAYDPYGNIATGYLGTVKFSSSDPKASLPANYTFQAGDAGTKTFSATLYTAATQTLTATDTKTSTITGTEYNIAVSAAAAKSMTLTNFPSPVTAGAAHTFWVVAYDAYGNVATGYTGTVKFTSSDSKASLPANYTFTPSNAGRQYFWATLNTVGVQSLTVTDTSNSSLTGTESGITVQAASVKLFTVTGFPSPVTAGTAHNLTVTGYDAYGNVATGYTGTVKFSSTDSKAVLPASYTFKTGDQGTKTFSATLNTPGVQSITATDTSNSSITGTESNITVKTAQTDRLAIIGLPDSVEAGTAYSFTVTAYDAHGHVATGYIGTVQFSGSDTAASLPAAYTFTGSDAGSHRFSIAFRTKGTHSLTITDSGNDFSTRQSGTVVS